MNTVAQAVLWHEYLALLPLVIGLVARRLEYVSRIWLALVGAFIVLPFWYMGVTGIAVAMDINSMDDKLFPMAIMLALIELAAGLLLSAFLYDIPKEESNQYLGSS